MWRRVPSGLRFVQAAFKPRLTNSMTSCRDRYRSSIRLLPHMSAFHSRCRQGSLARFRGIASADVSRSLSFMMRSAGTRRLNRVPPQVGAGPGDPGCAGYVTSARILVHSAACCGGTIP